MVLRQKKLYDAYWVCSRSPVSSIKSGSEVFSSRRQISVEVVKWLAGSLSSRSLQYPLKTFNPLFSRVWIFIHVHQIFFHWLFLCSQINFKAYFKRHSTISRFFEILIQNKWCSSNTPVLYILFDIDSERPKRSEIEHNQTIFWKKIEFLCVLRTSFLCIVKSLYGTEMVNWLWWLGLLDFHHGGKYSYSLWLWVCANDNSMSLPFLC